jgi:hypothetical protein
VSCPVCDKALSEGALPNHLLWQHGQAPHATPDQLPGPFHQEACLYTVNFPLYSQGVDCPVEGCPAVCKTRFLVRRHFTWQHPTQDIHIPEEGPEPLPKCEYCGLRASNTHSQAHIGTMLCQELGRQNERFRQQLAHQKARSFIFRVKDQPIESVDEFRYLGRIIMSTDKDEPALKRNLTRARQQWAKIRRILCRDGARPRVSAMFYKAVVQTVLLYGSETWCISGAMMSVLNVFHNRVARCITRRHICRDPLTDGTTWLYPSSTKTLQEAGLYPITTYLSRRRGYLLAYARSCSERFMERCSDTSTQDSNKYWWGLYGRDIEGHQLTTIAT